MPRLDELLDRNRNWAARMREQDPTFFDRLSQGQKPEYLWLGCSDSRVPSSEIVDVAPGDVFVHRNIANVAVHTDSNFLSVLQYAVDVLQVKHIIVCGHYRCGGVLASMTNKEYGFIDNWLRHIKDVYEKHRQTVEAIEDEGQRQDKMCELNAVEQVYNICHTTIVQAAWDRGQSLAVHGWIYRLSDGLIEDLGVSISSDAELAAIYRIRSP